MNTKSSPLLLDIHHLQTWFDTRGGMVKSVDGVNLQLRRGEILGLVGESGSGKSVTGYSIMGLIDSPGEIVGGQIMYYGSKPHGEDLTKVRPERMRSLRGDRIAMIFQDPMMSLNPVLRIDTQMIEAIRAHRDISWTAARERARETLVKVGIASPDERLESYPHQFSGGMRQRVAIATALLNEPDLIIADEPTTALDVTVQAQILYEVRKLCRETGTALIWITHDLALVSGLADRIAVMYAGRVVETGTVRDVIGNPRHPYTHGLMGSVPSNNARGKPLKQIPGMTPSLSNLPKGCAFAPRCANVQQNCLEHMPLEEAISPGHMIRCFNPAQEKHHDIAA
jgi:peptide/nickel transport system ATP-binding protein